jgi:hypothetical protein
MGYNNEVEIGYAARIELTVDTVFMAVSQRRVENPKEWRRIT